MSDEAIRLSKLMGTRGLCSRREADRLIEQGLVYVDGIQVNTLGTKVSPHCKIEISKEGAKELSRRKTILLYKPIGYVSGPKETDYPSALDLIQPENRAETKSKMAFHYQDKTGLAPAGRLDVDSTGLLILTSDGRVAKKVIGENTSIEKEYRVKVAGKITKNGLKLLNHGLEMDGDPLKPAEVYWEVPGEVLIFKLKQGKKRQVRRMCELVGLKATALKRVRVGSLNLKNLKPKQWRFLEEQEVEELLDF